MMKTTMDFPCKACSGGRGVKVDLTLVVDPSPLNDNYCSIEFRQRLLAYFFDLIFLWKQNDVKLTLSLIQNFVETLIQQKNQR